MKNKYFSLAGVSAGLLLLVIAVLMLAPGTKGFITTNLTKTGTKPPNASTEEVPINTTNTASSVPGASLAPSVKFKDGQGKTIDISEQKGKVLFINFWATWCPPCIAEMPSINKLQSQLNSQDILFLMVDVDNNYKKSQKFMEANNYDLPVYSPAGSIPGDLLSGAIPTTVIIDKTGRLIGRHEGGADYASPEAVDFFQKLINE